jgi:hypothetical protein
LTPPLGPATLMPMRALALVTLVLGATAARADGPPPKNDPPRWRLRATLAQGFGGGRDGSDAVARFPTSLEVGARVWGPLSLDAAVTATLAGEWAQSCGQPVRPNAIAGAVGVRADLSNGRSSPWIDPFVEVHGGIGAQSGAREVPGGCPAAATFGTAGARAGMDLWLGRGAVTLALAFDYLPVGSAVSFVMGGSFALF